MHNPRGSNDRNCERNANRNNGNRLFDSQNNNAGGYACPRAVGDENMQDDAGKFWYNSATYSGKEIAQNKRMYYYENSVLAIEWTDQHGCGGNSKVNCEIVIQYACEDTLDPKIDDFWPWTTNKGQAGTTYRDIQHFKIPDGSNTEYPKMCSRSAPDNNDCHVASPRDGVPRDADDAATQTIPDNEASAIPDGVETRRFGMHESWDYYTLCQRTSRNKGLYTASKHKKKRSKRYTSESKW